MAKISPIILTIMIAMVITKLPVVIEKNMILRKLSNANDHNDNNDNKNNHDALNNINILDERERQNFLK